jgi:prepilin-type N-terminal cleavage/methylation domain-containing protein
MKYASAAFRRGAPRKAAHAGFTLIEFLVAMSIFIVVTGAVFTLFRRDDPLFNTQQNTSTLNLSLQNAITQIQLDVINAGNGYYPGMQLPNWPIGLTIQNSANPPATGLCGDNTTFTYNAACFDTLNVIAMDPNTPPMHTGTTGGGCVNTTTTSMSLQPPSANTNAQNTTLAQTFKANNQVLLVTASGSVMTTVMLNATGSYSGGYIVLTFNATNSSGQNTVANDPLGITSYSNDSGDNNSHTQLGTSFCNTDWAMRMIPITYKVDDTDPTNPKLDRVQNGNTDVVATEIIGFKVGAALWSDTGTGVTDITNNNNTVTYNYNASTFGVTPPGYDFSIIRSIRVAIIGRTPPNATSANTFRNTYDQGPYQIQGLSIVVNPRNLSMDDP